MKIYGFQKTTLLDYPGHIAATVFTGGCNFRCPFCHNGSLVLKPESQPLIPEEEIMAHLKKRQGILDGICITGGEPALERDLREFILRCRAIGYLVKLDTNGYRPEILQKLLREGILDYVAMDIKASPENYSIATGCPECNVERIRESIRLLQASGIAHEFRTTAVKGIHSVEEFEEIGRMLAGSPVYYLQAYQDSGDLLGVSGAERGVPWRACENPHVKCEVTEPECSIWRAGKNVLEAEGDTGLRSMAAFSRQEMERMAELAGKYIDKVVLRGVE